jgi:hypothetical protein
MWYRACIVGVAECSEFFKHSFFMARLTVLIPLHCCDWSGNVFARLPNGDWMPLYEGCLQPTVMFHCCISQSRLIFMRNGNHCSKTHSRMVLTVHLYLIIFLYLCLPFTFYPYQIKTIFSFFFLNLGLKTLIMSCIELVCWLFLDQNLREVSYMTGNQNVQQSHNIGPYVGKL